jgi:acetyl-CoA carboxylase biotin carboxylase subunit
MFKKVLIANRGEIACRIADVCRKMGVATVAVFSEADREAPHVRRADEAVAIGGPRPQESYLDHAALLAAARKTGAEAIHPGYGFVSENAVFARACTDAGVVFIGPPPEAMERMKDKSEARKLAAAAGVPVVPGSGGLVGDHLHAAAEAERIGYPVIVKAAGGGGGIGMAVAENASQVEKAYRSCADRARSAFGKEGVYLERYFPAPRHIEVQILGDGVTTLHVLERECSIQRRHQKVVEEAGSPAFLEGRDHDTAGRMYQAAVQAARAFGYANAGTVEFLFADGGFHFIEMNARLQVEHPVTEATTGVDLIGWQLRIAAGEKLDLQQRDIARSGHAIELRIYAEDPDRFLPSPGKITRWRPPEQDGVRLDAGYGEGSTVTPYYDPMLAKLIARGRTRAEATETALAAVRSFVVEGVKTNLKLHERILSSEAFREGRLTTKFIEQLPK